MLAAVIRQHTLLLHFSARTPTAAALISAKVIKHFPGSPFDVSAYNEQIYAQIMRLLAAAIDNPVMEWESHYEGENSSLWIKLGGAGGGGGQTHTRKRSKGKHLQCDSPVGVQL